MLPNQKSILDVIKLAFEINNESAGYRVTFETFRNIDGIDVWVYPNGRPSSEAVLLKSSDISLLAIYSFLTDLKSKGVAA